MKLFEYTCDDCGERRRRLTVHKLDGSELHFCSIGCLNDFTEGDDSGDLRYHIQCQDISDGA